MKSSVYRISNLFARSNNLPTVFTAVELKSSQKALYVYGYGTIDPQGSCCACGRTLTHPGSILLGIGPECLNNWGLRDIKLDNITEADKLRLKELAQSKKVNQWIPKSVVQSKVDSEEKIDPPENLLASTITRAFKRASKEGDKIKIEFSYDPVLVTRVKLLPERKYNPTGKYWTTPIYEDIVKTLIDLQFEVTSDLKELLLKEESITESKVDPVEILKPLFPFQQKGLEFIESRKGRVLLADEMGLGKTIQAIAYLAAHPDKVPVCIVTPASLKYNWEKELLECLPDVKDKIQLLSGRTPIPITKPIIVINYDILSYWGAALADLNIQVLIADECHYFKANSTNRTKAMKKLVKGIPHFIAISGTPIVNRPIEIYNALKMINARAIPDFWSYTKRYCNAKNNGYGWDFNGASNTDELHQILTSAFMIRRKKEDVLKDLPDKIRTFIPFELDNQKEYDAVESDFINYVRMTRGVDAAEKVSNAETLAQIAHLKQTAIRGKMKSVVEWIRDFLESGSKLVVFAIHKAIIDEIMKTFPGISVKVDGSVPTNERTNIVNKFQEDPSIQLFVGNIKAAGVGLTLTASSNVAFIELPWTPGELVQAEDRCHRIGQKDSVNIYYLLAKDTIDSEIAALLDSKRKVLDSVLDGEVTDEKSLLSNLINNYKDEN